MPFPNEKKSGIFGEIVNTRSGAEPKTVTYNPTTNKELFKALGGHIKDTKARLKRFPNRVPWWLNGLKIQHCHCYGMSHSCSTHLIPGLGILHDEGTEKIKINK